MTKTVPIVLILLVVLSFQVTDAALSCYACNDCGTLWDASKATIVQTLNANYYCRKTVTGSLVSKDSVASCTSLNVLGHGVFCCQADLCNSANKRSMTIINLGFLITSLWTIYYYIY